MRNDIGREADRVERMEKRLLSASPFDQDANLRFAAGIRISRVVGGRGNSVEVSDAAPGEGTLRRIMFADSGSVVAGPAKTARTTRLRSVTMATFHGQILEQQGRLGIRPRSTSAEDGEITQLWPHRLVDARD